MLSANSAAWTTRTRALETFLALMPGYTTERAARGTLAFRDEAVFQHYLEGLRKAGWKG
jgi:hypothetical protein